MGSFKNIDKAMFFWNLYLFLNDLSQFKSYLVFDFGEIQIWHSLETTDQALLKLPPWLTSLKPHAPCVVWQLGQ